MTDNEKQFENFVRQIRFDDSPDPEHRNKLEQDLLRTLTKQTPRQIIIWRTIMKSKITKLATAAAIILIAVLSITFLEKSVTPAYAIEQTIEAMKRFSAIHLSGTMVMSRKHLEEGFNSEIVNAIFKDGQIPFEIWAQVNEQGTRSGNIKIEGANGMVGVADETETQIYIPKINTIYVQEGSRIMIDPWPSHDFLTEKQKESEDWKVLYGKDADTGQNRIFATCYSTKSGKSWWFEFDEETKLLVRFKQWENEYHQGKPEFDVQKIVYYEELPDEMFELEIPEGAKVVDEREQFEQILRDPDYGLVVNGLTEEEACKKIVEEYWRAMINEDWQRAQKLRGLANETWEKWKAQYYDNMPLEVIEIKEPYPEKDWMTTPMTIKMADGRIKEGKLLVKFREIENMKSCLIIGNYGPRELNDIE